MIITYHCSRGNLVHLTGSIQLNIHLLYRVLLIASPAIDQTVHSFLPSQILNSSRDPHEFSIVHSLLSLVQPLRKVLIVPDSKHC